MTSVPQSRINEYWDWIAVAIFLLLTVDMLTTVYAAHVVGTAVEANPFMRWALSQGFIIFAIIHLCVGGLSIGLFYGLLEMLHRTPPEHQHHFARIIEVWLGIICAVGLFIFANNLMVIFFGESLL